MRNIDVFGICYNFIATIYIGKKGRNIDILVGSWWGDIAFESDWKRMSKGINPKDENDITETEGYRIACKFIEFYSELIQMDPNDYSLKDIYKFVNQDIIENKYNSEYWKIWHICWVGELIQPWFKSGINLDNIMKQI